MISQIGRRGRGEAFWGLKRKKQHRVSEFFFAYPLIYTIGKVVFTFRHTNLYMRLAIPELSDISAVSSTLIADNTTKRSQCRRAELGRWGGSWGCVSGNGGWHWWRSWHCRSLVQTLQIPHVKYKSTHHRHPSRLRHYFGFEHKKMLVHLPLCSFGAISDLILVHLVHW
jgi:hypothetical protein